MRYVDIGTDKQISKIGLGTHLFGSSKWGNGAQPAGREARPSSAARRN